MPFARRSPSFSSCAMMSSVPVPVAGGGGWYCCGGGWYCCGGGCWYWGSAYGSCAAHRFACRRETRFDTAVAVPAATAVRAIPPIRPMSLSSSSCECEHSFADDSTGAYAELRSRRLELVEGRDDLGRGDPAAGDDVCSLTTQRCDERAGPGVLIQQQADGVARLDQRGTLGDVVVAQDPGLHAFEH